MGWLGQHQSVDQCGWILCGFYFQCEIIHVYCCNPFWNRDYFTEWWCRKHEHKFYIYEQQICYLWLGDSLEYSSLSCSSYFIYIHMFQGWVILFLSLESLGNMYRILMRFFLKFGTQICEVLNLWMKHWTALRQIGLLWTRPCGAKAWPASPNYHVRSLLFWDITQRYIVFPCGHFRTIYQSHLQGSINPKERKEHDLS